MFVNDMTNRINRRVTEGSRSRIRLERLFLDLDLKGIIYLDVRNASAAGLDSTINSADIHEAQIIQEFDGKPSMKYD